MLFLDSVEDRWPLKAISGISRVILVTWYRISLRPTHMQWRPLRHQRNVYNKLNFQAVIKLAASAASRKPKSREGGSRGVPRGRCLPAEPPSCPPLELPSLDLGFLEAALAADLITA